LIAPLYSSHAPMSLARCSRCSASIYSQPSCVPRADPSSLYQTVVSIVLFFDPLLAMCFLSFPFPCPLPALRSFHQLSYMPFQFSSVGGIGLLYLFRSSVAPSRGLRLVSAYFTPHPKSPSHVVDYRMIGPQTTFRLYASCPLLSSFLFQTPGLPMIWLLSSQGGPPILGWSVFIFFENQLLVRGASFLRFVFGRARNYLPACCSRRHFP